MIDNTRLHSAITFFLSLLFLAGYSQTRTSDSLRTILKTAPEDTVKVNTLHQLCIALQNEGDYTAALTTERECLALAQKLHWEKGIAKAYNSIGVIELNSAAYPEARQDFLAAQAVRQKLGDRKGVAASYNNIGVTFFHQGNYPEALQNYFAALKIKEQINDQPGIANAYNAIGGVYVQQGNYTQALQNYFAALAVADSIDDQQDLANTYGNIGGAYQLQGNNAEALKNHLLALKIEEALGDQEGVADSYINIGLIYKDEGNYPEAFNCYSKALKIAEAAGDQQAMATAYVNMSSAYLGLKNYRLAEEYSKKGLAIATEVGELSLIRDANQNLSEIYTQTHRYAEALVSYRAFVAARDSLVNQENTRKTVETQLQYDFDKKQTADSIRVAAEQKLSAAKFAEERKLSAAKLEQEKKQRYYLYGGLAIVVVFSGFLFNRFKVTQKQKRIIEIKEQETQQQKHLVEEKNKEITDSITYAKRLQDAILPSQEYIHQHLSDSFILYQPKDIVAGDFYWMEISGDNIFIAAADSTGHGVPGAMVSVVCSNALNRAVKEFGLTVPGEILDKTRELVVETFAKSSTQVRDGMDISLLCINKVTRNISWSGANNSLCYAVPGSGELLRIKADKQPIGKAEFPTPFTTHAIGYAEHTIFYLFTDGFVDQFGGEKGKKFMFRNLEKLLTDHLQLPLAEQHALLKKEFAAWKGALEQVDDVTIIGVKI